MKISAVILAKNEEKNIKRAVESVRFCDEIIIIDDDSIDKTIEIVHKVLKVHKVYKVLRRRINGDFAAQRNFAMKQVSNDWILFIDADEIVSEDLRQEIITLFNTPEVLKSAVLKSAYYIKRRDFWWGRELKFGETQKARNIGIIRLVNKNSGKWMGNVHEEYKIKDQRSKIKTLNGYINHYPHQTVKEFLQEINFYSTLRAQKLFTQGKKTNILEIIFYPFFKFILVYFIYLGFLDGAPGFAYAFFMSFHSFLVRAKLHQYNEH